MALLQTAAQLSASNPIVQQIIDREVIKMITPPDETSQYLAQIGTTIAEPQENATDWMQDPDSQKGLVKEKESEDIFNSEIQDKGVTTNDPLARQLVMLGVGR
jgi:hypothetical protein